MAAPNGHAAALPCAARPVRLLQQRPRGSAKADAGFLGSLLAPTANQRPAKAGTGGERLTARHAHSTTNDYQTASYRRHAPRAAAPTTAGRAAAICRGAAPPAFRGWAIMLPLSVLRLGSSQVKSSCRAKDGRRCPSACAPSHPTMCRARSRSSARVRRKGHALDAKMMFSHEPDV